MTGKSKKSGQDNDQSKEWGRDDAMIKGVKLNHTVGLTRAPSQKNVLLTFS